MRKKQQKSFITILFFALLCTALFSLVHGVNAYERYYDGCHNCHGLFKDDDSPKDSTSGNDNKMDMHTVKDFMESDCNLCHSSGSKENPFIGSSRGTDVNPGVGCTGCHGREEDAGHDSLPGGRGAGLRQHHWNRKVVVDTPIGPVSTRSCVDCHSDTDPANYTPVGEHVMPVYYGTGDTEVDGPCNPIARQNTNENWTVGDFIGLDNDGDGLYDMDDPDCAAACTPTGISETICNGIDDDCDGLIDEDFISTPTTCGTGECESTGLTTCVGGVEGDSCTPGTPSAELCDGLDNNCDGSTDEDFANLGASCTVGMGACEANGNYVCTADGLGTECDATPGTPGIEGPEGDPTCSDVIDNDCDGQEDGNDPDCSCNPTGTPETVCNGVDDDCDGQVDEDYTSASTTCGTGVCASTGQTTCVGGVEGNTCIPGTPSAEICDGLDNNCNSSIDEDFTNIGTACTVGTGACEANGNYVCTADGRGTECDATPGTPGVEGPAGDPTCSDGNDNDCDGTADAGDPDCSCAPTGTPENVCNGVDDDCDGQVDEDYTPTSMTCGVGECASTGQTTCAGGVEGDTCTPVTPGVEGPEGDPTCTDGSDNDCDGQTDGLDNDCGYVPPPVRQEIGRPDSAYNDLLEADCRFCHENPDQFPVQDEIIPNRHHLLVDTQVLFGTCSQTTSTQCQNDGECPVGEFCINGSNAPFPPPPGGIYECLTCHEAICDVLCEFIVERDCLACHVQNPVSEYTVHHRTDLAQGVLPQGPDCQFCHGSLVDNRDDGHEIPAYTPQNETPKRSGGTGIPFNSRGNGAGACDYCHDSGISTEGIIVEINQITHHNRGFGFDDTKCDWCHDFTLPFEAQIRVCENCHGFNTLHSIQADSDGDGVISAGIEQPFYGHIGNPDDCWGCHGYGPPSPATNTSAVVPTVSSTSSSVITEGTAATIDITGSAFTNLDQQGAEVLSDVSLEAEDGSTSITLTPDAISQDTITVTIPDTLPAGNYKVKALKQGKFSNPKVISIKPAVIITNVDCSKKMGLLTITGSGFGDKPEGTDTYINVEMHGQIADPVSWRDDQIRVPVTDCKKKSLGNITVNTLYGSASWKKK